ncbi:metal ABC transporter substrate-binding protein [Zavarzinia sp.]|uniref:metal ABC transporter substrate-binding protein n=1 Tax=Zavarzinia sp. TaxID=2027920 RepID=UPI003BB7EB5E
MLLRPFLLALGLSTIATAALAEPVKVVASFSILGDMVANVGGDHIALTTLVGPDGDAHVFQPSPRDARAVAGANLVIISGLGFEGWMERLTEAAAYKGKVVVASAGVTPREMAEEEEGHAEDGHDDHGHGNIDPHAWQDLSNGLRYVDNIAAGLIAADPANADDYRARAAAYRARLGALDAKVKAAINALPAERRKIITSHDAFGYFAAAYGLEVLAPQGVSTESEASAKGVALLINQIKETKAPAVFLENVTDPRLIEQIARETGAHIGGTLYSDALSDASGDASTYIAMFEHNVAMLTAALGS